MKPFNNRAKNTRTFDDLEVIWSCKILHIMGVRALCCNSDGWDGTDGRTDNIPYGAKNLILPHMIQITQMFLLVKLLVGALV